MRSAVAATGVLVAAVLARTFWYGRNFVQTGNPLGFARVQVAGITVFNGALDANTIVATTLWTQFRFGNARDWQVLVGQVHKQLGPVFVISVVAACIAAFLGARPLQRRRGTHLVAALVLATGLAYWATPFTANMGDGGPITPWIGQAMRYAFPFIGMVAAAAGVLLGEGPVMNLVAPAALIAAVVDSSTRFVWFAAAFLLFGWVLHRAAAARYSRIGELVSVCVVVAAVSLLASNARGVRDSERTRLYRGLPRFIEGQVGPDDVIGYALSHNNYLFYGTHFDRTVVYVPARSDDRDAWLADLRAHHVTFLAMGPVRPEWRTRKEFAWVHKDDGAFVRVFGRDDRIDSLVYRVAPAPSGRE